MIGGSVWVWSALAALVSCSAFFNASETALFSLAPAERRRAGHLATRLLEDPRSVLVALLLGNLLVNISFFALATRLARRGDPTSEIAVAVGALVCLLVAGEILPKLLALRARVPIARGSALPLSMLVVPLAPLRRALDRFLEALYRALGEAGREERGITPESLAEALDRSAERGLLLDIEAELLTGIVRLQEVRAREIMTPRVDMLLLDASLGARGESERREIVRRAVEAKLAWVTLVDGNPDRVLGRVRVRDLLTQPARPLEELLAPVKFVPEVASALHVLHFLREQHVAQALVIDEWGGTAGLVTIENIFEEIVGDLRVEGEPQEKPVVALGEGRFRVVGSLSIRDWNQYFGHRVVPTEFETVGGFVTALLGRIPRAGDEVRSGRLVFRVHEVRRRRIVTLELFVDPGLEASA